MFSDICFYVKGNIIEVNGQDFLLGELTESCMNINNEQFHEIYFGLEKFEEIIPDELPEQDEFEQLKNELFRIDKLLRVHKIFQVLGEPIEVLQAGFENDIFDNWNYFHKLFSQYDGIIRDIYSFNVTIKEFIVNWIGKLIKCDAENHAATYFDFLNSPMAYKYIVNPIYHDGFIYSNIEFLSSMNLVPKETYQGSNRYVIAEYYHTSVLQSFLKIDFLKGLMVGHSIRRCEHCKRFFLVTNGYKTRFCDKPSLENPKFTCKQIAYRKTHTKDSHDNDPKYQMHRKAVHRIMRSCQRGTITEEVRDQLLNKAEAIYHTAATTPKYSDQEFEEQMSSDNLYKLCGLEPPKRGRPKAVKNENG